MCPPAARALPALLLALCALSPMLTAFKPFHPRNVKLTSVEKGLKVTWDPPNELDGRPVDRYSIGYGKSMRSLRFIKVDKDRRSEVLEDVEPGVLHFLKISSENEDGMSKPVYRAETPGGGELVKLDGFAVEGGASANASSPGRRSSERSSKISPRPTVQRSTVLRQRAPQSSSGPEAPRRGGYLPIRSQNKHRVDLSQPQADQRNAKPKLASESIYVVSLQAQKAPQRTVPASKTVNTESPPTEHDEVEEVEDITVRILSPQSVVITWVDPLIKKQKSFPEGIRQYTVRYREKGESARWEYKETSQKRLVIEKLSADGMYEFSVRITQGDAHGKWSVSVFQRTPESAPAGPPENFEVKSLRGKGTAVTATWDPPDEPNGKIREYILSYAPALKPFGAKSVTYRGTTTSATIDGLTPGDRYIFKIRAANRKGQGPQSKTLSVAMPGTSTAASRHSTQSKSSSRTSVYDDLEDQDTEDTEKSLTHTTTSPPTNKKSRPLSQTRSYHSIFSSLRGSVRNSGSNSRSTTSSDKEEDEEETPTDTPKEDEATANEAVEDTQPESTNNAPSKTEKEEQHKVSPGAKESSPILKSSLPKTHTFPPMSKEGHHQSQSLTPRTSSVVNGNRLRRPPSSTSWSRTRSQSAGSSSLPNSQDPVVSKKVYTSLYPEGKVSNSVVESSTPSPTPSPQETKSKTERESSSSSLSPAGASRVSSPGSHASNSGPSSVYPNGRRVTQTKGHRYQTGRQKTALTSSALSQSSTVSSNHDGDTQSTSVLDTKHNRKNDPRIKIQNNEDTPQYTTTLAPPIKEENKGDFANNNYKDKAVNSYLPSSQIPSTATPAHGSSLSSRNSRIVIGSSQRKDGRIPWSRAASSVGAGRPVLRGMPAKPTASGEHVGGKTKTSPTTYTTKHLVDSNLAKPTVKSRQAASSNGQTSNDHKEDTISGNDHKHDYLSEVSKETHESKNSAPTASPQKTASDAKQIQRSGQTSDNSSQASYMTLNKLGLGSNGKVRSALLASRLNELRLRGRLQTVQNTQLGSAAKQNSSSSSVSTSSSSSASQKIEKKASPSDQVTGASQNANVRSTVGLASRSALMQPTGGETSNDFKTPLTAPARNPVVRSRYPSRSDKNSRGKTPVGLHKPSYGQGKNVRPNLTATNGKIVSTSNEDTKGNGVKYITGPDGTRWVVDLDKGVLMNEEGKVLQDSRGRPRKVVIGEDGKTIFDEEGTPLVNQEGMALFGHGRDSRPVVNPKDKYLTVGGKPLVGLDRPTPSTTTTTTTTPTTTTSTTTTTTTTTAEPTTTEITTLEYTTEALPTCPPGTFPKLDKNGIPMVDDYGILDCYPSDEFLMETTMIPITTQLPQTTHTPTTEFHVFNNSPSSEFDAAGKKRFTAPYVNYIQKDPGAPCSLTEALEYLQVDVLADLIEKDSATASQKQPPKHKPHNITVIAMEGCHSFVILDWARPLKDDMVSGYMVHSASYDDVLNDRWSSSLSSGTHLAVENLKPNSRYYFRVQAKNVFGLGPISETISYVTESDDPLLIERPPGGEPIWIPFSFRFNPAHSSCKGSQFVKRTWYRKFVGVVLCNSLRYKIFMGDGLKETFYSIADSFGNGEDHCQFVDSHLDGRTGPQTLSIYLPQAQGYYRSYRQEPVNFGPIGRRTPHQFVGWYECGIPIPGKW